MNYGAATLNMPIMDASVSLRLGILERELRRGIPFDEAIGSDELGLDIVIRGLLQVLACRPV